MDYIYKYHILRIWNKCQKEVFPQILVNIPIGTSTNITEHGERLATQTQGCTEYVYVVKD